MLRPSQWVVVLVSLAAAGGCATQKESHTPRTGVEQLLISSAIDSSLDQIDLQPLARRHVFLETKYLDCVDKNYVIVSLHHRLLGIGARMVEKADDADVVLEVCSGGVGTDSQELFVGVPEIPLAPPSPVAIPKLALFTRSRLNGTAKLLVLAYEPRTQRPVIHAGVALARSDQNNWNILGAGPVQTGTLPQQIAEATGNADFNVVTVMQQAVKYTFPVGGEQKPQEADGVRLTGSALGREGPHPAVEPVIFQPLPAGPALVHPPAAPK